MSASWNENYRPEVIIGVMEKHKVVLENGNIGFENMPDIYSSVLMSAVKLSDHIPTHLKQRLIWKAIKTIAQKDKLSANKLLSEISKKEKAYLKQPLSKYTLITNISLKYSTNYKNIKINDSTIKFTSGLPEKFFLEREKILSWAKNTIHGQLPKGYTFVQVSTKTRSYEEAADRALGSINIVRAIWNIYFEGGRVRKSWGERKPANFIILGPIHTIHQMDGPPFPQVYYDPNYMKLPNAPTELHCIQLRFAQFRSVPLGFRNGVS